jgi:NDP-sugar pyrophosphorylase family protein
LRLPVCILAGGLGTRLGEQVRDTPKPLLEVAGEPFLLHQLRDLADAGVRRVVLCVGYLGERIEARIGPERFGIEIAYVYDGPSLAGTAGAVRGALPVLGDAFLVLYGDAYLTVDYAAFERAFLAAGTLGMMAVFRNEGRWDRSNVVLAGDRVALYDKRRDDPRMHWIDYGLGAYRAAALDGGEVDLSAIQARLAADREMAAFEVSERFYEIGTPGSLAETEAFLRRPRGTGASAGSGSSPP